MTRHRKTRLRKTDKNKLKGREYQGMAIRSMGKIGQEKQKTKTSNTSEKKLTSNSDFITNPQKKEVNVTERNVIPEAFNSSTHESVTKMKEPADLKKEDSEEVATNVEREGASNSENAVSNQNLDNSSYRQSLQQDPSSLSPQPGTILSDVDIPNLQERIAALSGSKQEVQDQDAEMSEIVFQQGVKDKQSVYEKRRGVEKDGPPGTAPKYITPWFDVANAWTRLHVEYFENDAVMTEHCLDQFSKVWVGGYKKDKVKVE